MMRKELFTVFLIFFTLTLWGMTPGETENLWNKARQAEAEGDIPRAEQLYDSLCTAYPRNNQYLSRYKSVLIRSERLEKALKISQQMYRLNPRNTNLVAEAGALMMALGRKDEAFRYWEPYLGKKNAANRIPPAAIMYLTAYSNSSGLPEMIQFFRKQLNDPLHQSQTYFSQLIQREMWEPALEEFLLHREKSPRTLPVLTRKLKTLEPDHPLFPPLIEALKKRASKSDDYILIADLALQSERYKLAVSVLEDHIPPVEPGDVLTLAQKLYNAGKHTLSLQCLNTLTRTGNHKIPDHKILFLKAVNFDALSFDKPSRLLEIIPPYHSMFLSIPVTSRESMHKRYLDSALVYLEKAAGTNISETSRYEARTRLARLKLYTGHDADAAESLLKNIPPSLPEPLRNEMFTLLVQCRIFKNDPEGARQLIHEAPAVYRLNARQEDRLRLNLIYIDLAFNQQDSLEYHLNEALALADPSENYSNDLLALAVYLQSAAEYPEIAALEQFIRRAGWPRFLKEAEKLMNSDNPVKSLAAFRMEKVLRQTGMQEELDDFWRQYKDDVTHDPILGDYFTILYAEYLAKRGKKEKAGEILKSFITTCPDSPYLESVRQVVRQ